MRSDARGLAYRGSVICAYVLYMQPRLCFIASRTVIFTTALIVAVYPAQLSQKDFKDSYCNDQAGHMYVLQSPCGLLLTMNVK